MSHKSVVFFWVLFLFFSSKVYSAEENVGGPQLKNAIKSIALNARVLTGSDLDTSSCGKKKNPGIIEADFKGDGQKDYAVLLKIGQPEETVYTSNGKSTPWNKLRVWFVVFLGQTDGSFKSIILEKIDDHSFPAYVTLKKINPGHLENFDSGKRTSLKNAGIGLEFCEQSETVYYWDELKNGFKKISTQD